MRNISEGRKWGPSTTRLSVQGRVRQKPEQEPGPARSWPQRKKAQGWLKDQRPEEVWKSIVYRLSFTLSSWIR